MTTTVDTRGPADEDQVRLAVTRLLAAFPPTSTPETEFLGAQFDAGLAWVHFPVGHGGLGLSRRFQPLIYELLAAGGASLSNLGRNGIGYGMAAPTILAQGSDEMRLRYLRPLFTCEEIWCQLFSEPGAGSDLAGLSTRATRDGDEWIINGQKCWTSVAHRAHFGLLLARSNPDAEKHRGLTYFVVDMHAPGVEVRPLRQMTGDAEFNEEFLTDVRIADRERLSDVGQGWNGALVTLMNERVSIGGSVQPRGGGGIGRAVELWRKGGCQDPARRDRLMQLWVEAEVLRLNNLRAAEASRLGTPGPEGSIGKLAYAEHNKRIYDLCVDLLGPEGMLYDSYDMHRPAEMSLRERLEQSPQRHFLRSRANSIEGGSSEVMRNILGERVLGLPGDVRVDKDRPWSEVPRS
jgi:alkylation response protein AidB-like acyl-CoA dehydrogenase